MVPYLATWRDALSVAVTRGTADRVTVSGFSTDTVAEAIIAGRDRRHCRFAHRAGENPCGVAMVQLPASQRTAIFKKADRVTGELIEKLVEQLSVPLDVATSESKDVDRRRVEAELRVRKHGVGEERMGYYFVFRDADASAAGADTLWELTMNTLTGPSGLPSLALVRMQGEPHDDELLVERLVAAVLRATANDPSP